MIYLHKVLPLFASPLFISLVLILVYFIVRKKIFLILSLIVTLFFSNSLISNKLLSFIEHPFTPVSIHSIEKSDFIIVLSGDTQRFFAGINLYKASKAKKIIFTAAKLPWTKNKINEGQFYKLSSMNLGIKEENILVTGIVKNTFDEVEEISKLVPIDSSVILVTSSIHMHRVIFLLKKYKLKINPFPISNSKNNEITLMDFIPNASALNTSSIVIRELQGRIYYKIIELFN